MQGPKITKECVAEVTDKKFLRVFDLQYAEGKHYFDATRRSLDNIVATKTEEEFKTMLPDAVSCVVICKKSGEEPRLLLSYEYRYPTGRFLLSVPAGLLDPEDADTKDPIVTTAIREIHEETGVVVDESKDEVKVINPLLFSTPGMTDESNAFLSADITIPDTSMLNQTGAVGSELFNGFELVSVDEAKEIYRSGKDIDVLPPSLF